ncbi:MAG: hypothetical protein AAF843_01260 [Bacteroidota bacterium]
MDKVKKVLRLIGFVVVMVITSVGLGIAPALGNRKEEYLNREIKTEMVDEQEEDELDEVE